jgi:hypothetical protein|uniref:Uncharacterized protein n=1 Tax=Zea mays TaxID=4577 RepID=B6SJC5_MAIZE|nr:hypothetical protein [Zea mays]
MCFDNILIKSSIDIICHAGAIIISWARLSKKEPQDLLREGARLLFRAANAGMDNQLINSIAGDKDYAPP